MHSGDERTPISGKAAREFCRVRNVLVGDIVKSGGRIDGRGAIIAPSADFAKAGGGWPTQPLNPSSEVAPWPVTMMFPLGNPENWMKPALGKPPATFGSGLVMLMPITPTPALFTANAGKDTLYPLGGMT